MIDLSFITEKEMLMGRDQIIMKSKNRIDVGSANEILKIETIEKFKKKKEGVLFCTPPYNSFKK